MELGLLFLFGLTITSTAGSSPPRPRSLPAGGDPRSAALGQKQREESGAAAVPGGGGRAKADGGVLRRRARRCTCYTYKDKECVYYCHLDIIWINTPERTVPYGLSNYRGSFRGKRSTGQNQSISQPSFRCSCLDIYDKQCMQFCRRMQDRRRNHGSVKTTEKDQCREEEHAFVQ
ncbi:endothelin-3 [Lagopus leucura]|uniref:endothelin-3 n=1 Tax=Lagopus leucura TaxID=30410 RepID=UPI001C672DDD|nr:endothelin-3 [Lagopus leucura]XP_042740875.1 endothelin-3 [Lagopus leucura]XP_042740876.1 endothelin-3 [Lagopus leucura]